MKKDFEIPEVKDIAIAIVPEENEEGEKQWEVYFLNMKETLVKNVLINASASGIINGEVRKTATLRLFLKDVEAQQAKKIELLMPEAFALDNQYWVSFYEGENIFDKKYIASAGSIVDENLTLVPLLNKQGILIR